MPRNGVTEKELQKVLQETLPNLQKKMTIPQKLGMIHTLTLYMLEEFENAFIVNTKTGETKRKRGDTSKPVYGTGHEVTHAAVTVAMYNARLAEQVKEVLLAHCAANPGQAGLSVKQQALILSTFTSIHNRTFAFPPGAIVEIDDDDDDDEDSSSSDSSSSDSDDDDDDDDDDAGSSYDQPAKKKRKMSAANSAKARAAKKAKKDKKAAKAAEAKEIAKAQAKAKADKEKLAKLKEMETTAETALTAAEGEV